MKLNIDDLPNQPAVYMLEGLTCKKHLKRYYVGAAKYLRNRVNTHMAKKTSFGRLCNGNVHVVYYQPTHSYRTALVFEKQLKKLNKGQRNQLARQFAEDYTKINHEHLQKINEFLQKLKKQETHQKK